MSYKLIDLTHTLTSSTPSWDGGCGYHLMTDHDYLDDSSVPFFKVQSLSMPCGIGTHMDAPAHCIKGAATIDQISMDLLINPGIVIDISDRLHADNCLTAHDIQAFEARNGRIEKNCCVLINTGWHQYWNTPKLYHNQFYFPYVHSEAADLLCHRNIRALCIDTLSPDRPDSGYPVHSLLLSQHILIVENVANLSQLPPNDFSVTIAPLMLGSATESPVRMWATI